MQPITLKRWRKFSSSLLIDGFVLIANIILLLILYRSIRSIISFGVHLNKNIGNLLHEKSYLRNAATKALKNGRIIVQDYDLSVDSIMLQDDLNLTMLLTIFCAILLPVLFAVIYCYILHLSHFAKQRSIVLTIGFLSAALSLFYYEFNKFLSDQEPYTFFLTTVASLIIYLFLYVFIINTPKESGGYYESERHDESTIIELVV